MRKRRRRTGAEINLTPLLDVLFSILFLVMLANYSSQNQLQQAFAETGARKEEEIAALTGERDSLAEEIAGLKEENAALGEAAALLGSDNSGLLEEKERLTSENQQLNGEITGLMNVIDRLNVDKEALAAEKAELQTEVEELTHEQRVVEGLSSTYQTFESMCTFVTIFNSARGSRHVLEIYVGEDTIPRASVTMNVFGREELKQEVIDRIGEILAELSEEEEKSGTPVFIVFNQDESAIFHSDESVPVIEALEYLQEHSPQVYKEVRVIHPDGETEITP